jgi:hypothetical protein
MGFYGTKPLQTAKKRLFLRVFGGNPTAAGTSWPDLCLFYFDTVSSYKYTIFWVFNSILNEISAFFS